MLVFFSWLVLWLLLVGCGGGQQSSSQATQHSTQPSGSSSAKKHVFAILMENKGYDQALGGEYMASLVSQYAVATNYHAVAHPSLPNYLALTSGSTWGITDDNYHSLSGGEDLGSELTSADIPWRAYMEDMTDGCFDSPYPYALKHNPFAFYGGQCPSTVVDLSQLDADLLGDTPNFVWITPSLCHDEHDCSVGKGDQWLAQIVPKITESAAWKDDGVLFIVWDEDDKQSGPNRVPLIVASPNLKEHQTGTHYDHYSLLATIEDWLGVERLGDANKAQAIEDLF
jgi:hypothetical protein